MGFLNSQTIRIIQSVCYVFGASAPQWAMASSFARFLDYTQRRTTVSRTPLEEWPARLRDLYLTTHNTHNRQTFMHPVAFEPTISVSERPQTYSLDRAATGTGNLRYSVILYSLNIKYYTFTVIENIQW